MLSGQKQFLLLERVHVQLPEPTWWLTTVCNSSSRESNALFQSPQALSGNGVRHTSRRSAHTHKNRTLYRVLLYSQEWLSALNLLPQICQCWDYNRAWETTVIKRYYRSPFFFLSLNFYPILKFRGIYLGLNVCWRFRLISHCLWQQLSTQGSLCWLNLELLFFFA